MGEWVDVPEDTQAALLGWYNVSCPDDEDRKKLANLWFSGRFRYWQCSGCGDLVFEGLPEDWNEFQGVCQIDTISFPGSVSMCDDCRAWGVARS